MLYSLFNFIVNNLTFFTGAYSNNVFPDPLSKEEEEKYIEKMMKGDKEARAKLIEHNLRLVAHIVKKFESSTNDVDDLIGIGTVGLIKGIDSFSPDKNIKLATYIAKCSENEILMHFRSDKKNSKNVSIYDGISYDKEGNEITILDVLKTENPDYAEEIYKNDNIKLLRKYLNILTKREREVFSDSLLNAHPKRVDTTCQQLRYPIFKNFLIYKTSGKQSFHHIPGCIVRYSGIGK